MVASYNNNNRNGINNNNDINNGHKMTKRPPKLNFGQKIIFREMAGGTFFGVIDDSGLNVGDGDQKDQDEGQSRQSGHRVGKKSRHLDFLFLTLPGNFYFSKKIIWVPLPSSRSDQIILLVLFQATKGIPLSPSLSFSLSLLSLPSLPLSLSVPLPYYFLLLSHSTPCLKFYSSTLALSLSFELHAISFHQTLLLSKALLRLLTHIHSLAISVTVAVAVTRSLALTLSLSHSQLRTHILSVHHFKAHILSLILSLTHLHTLMVTH